ncbi:MAG: Smr/MutS family protein, partial [Gemmatimonadota bacterium]
LDAAEDILRDRLALDGPYAEEVQTPALWRDVAASQASLQERAQRMAEREKAVRERERAAERESRKEARRYLLEARSTIEKTIKEIKRSKEEALEDVARAARQKVEQMATRQGERIEQLEREAANQLRRLPRPRDETPLVAGDFVQVLPLEGKVARVMEVRPDDILVALGSVKLAYSRDQLRRASAEQRPTATAVAYTGDLPEERVPTEIDLRGERMFDIDDTLLGALDAAIRADLRSLRIIHGKGTGALRDRVAEMLRKDTRVKSFRLGLWNEGGSGVTIAEL